jgi:hypothetical protein
VIGPSLLAGATKISISASVAPLVGIALVAGMLTTTVAVIRAAAAGAQTRSDADLRGRLRALDELVAQGCFGPEGYAQAQAALLKEI